MERQPIPTDHLIPPTTGQLLKNWSLGPDIPWEADVWWAERTAGDLEVGRLEPLPCTPVAQLYVDSPALNFEMGWCRDA